MYKIFGLKYSVVKRHAWAYRYGAMEIVIIIIIIIVLRYSADEWPESRKIIIGVAMKEVVDAGFSWKKERECSVILISYVP